MKRIKKFKVVFWLMSGEYEEIVDAYSENNAREIIYEKYKDRFCQINFVRRLNSWQTGESMIL